MIGESVDARDVQAQADKLHQKAAEFEHAGGPHHAKLLASSADMLGLLVADVATWRSQCLRAEFEIGEAERMVVQVEATAARLRTAGAEALTCVTATMSLLDDALAELRRDPRQTRGGYAVGHMAAAMEQARGTLAGLDALASAVTGHRAGEDGA